MRLRPLLIAIALCATSVGCSRALDTAALLSDRHPGVLYAVETEAQVMALTIDDGPDPTTTPRILSLLAEHDASATFFLISERIPGNEALVEAIVAAGHELGNHMTRDEPSIDLAPEAFESELLRAHQALSAYASPRWLRPGSGWYDDEMVEAAGYHGYALALGTVYPLDAHIASSGFARRFVLWRAKPGAVIVLHDGGERGERTVETLAAILPELQSRGYRVVSLSELAALERAGD